MSDIKPSRTLIGRKEELEKIHKLLNESKGRRVVVYGPRGIGKTHLASEYARQHQQGYTAIFWFNARDEAALKQGFERVADRILHEHPSVPYIKDALSDNDPELQVQAVRKWLAIKENKRWLVIYDHYDPAGKEFNIVPYLPRKIESHGTVIITTRSAQENLGHRIKVGKLKSLEERQLAQR